MHCRTGVVDGECRNSRDWGRSREGRTTTRTQSPSSRGSCWWSFRGLDTQQPLFEVVGPNGRNIRWGRISGQCPCASSRGPLNSGRVRSLCFLIEANGNTAYGWRRTRRPRHVPRINGRWSTTGIRARTHTDNSTRRCRWTGRAWHTLSTLCLR